MTCDQGRVLRRISFALLGGAVLSVLAGAEAGRAEAGTPRVERITLGVPGLPAGLDGLTVAQVSDLHLGPWIGVQHAAQGMALARAEHPDLIVLTGDYVHAPRPPYTAMVEPVLAGLRAPLGVFGVLGNHDYYGGDHRLLRRVLSRAGVEVLDNSARRIAVDGAELWLAGVDDMRWGRPSLRRALAGIPAGSFTLLLSHEPDLADLAAGYPVAVQLSGHTHGGQVRLPGIRPVWTPRLGRKYLAGLYRVGGLWLYVNRGLGAGFPPLRLNCPPEVALIRLTRG